MLSIRKNDVTYNIQKRILPKTPNFKNKRVDFVIESRKDEYNKIK